MSPLQVIDAALFLPLIERARKSPRLRINHNFHSSLEDNPHRFLNVMIQGTYIAPHRHRNPPKSESFLVLEGELAFFTCLAIGCMKTLAAPFAGPANQAVPIRACADH